MRRPSFALLVLVLVLAPVGSVPARGQSPVTYQPPVDGVVLRPFDAPAHAYAPGHRGVDLEVAAGGAVRAAADGEVVFAGTVAGARWVTVRHADAIRTSYGTLDELRVGAGDEVVRGQIVATASGGHGDRLRPEPGLHWSARLGATYIDPFSLLAAPPRRPSLVGPGGWRGTHPVVEAYAPYPGGSRFGVLATPTPTADRPGFARPPNHHHLVQVPGYGTAGPHPVLDPSYLGYGADDSSVFSYRGCDPSPTGCDPRPYGGQDTDVSIDAAASLLDAQLRARQAAQPHRPVDLLGHSMGGDVITHYLTYVYDPADPGLPPIGHAVTIATPHGGSGTASVGRAIGDDPILGVVGELGRQGARVLGVEGAGRVALGSRPVARYGAPVWGPRPARDPARLAELDVDLLEIAGSRDLVVGRTDAGSVGRALVLPGGHGGVTAGEAAHETVHAFLGGRPLAEVGGRVGWASDAVSDAGRTLGALIDAGPWSPP